MNLENRSGDKEVWQKIEGTNNSWISNYGRVKGARGFLSPFTVSNYLAVSVYIKGKKTTKYVHQLVAEAFLNKQPEEEVHFLNENRQDCSIYNLSLRKHEAKPRKHNLTDEQVLWALGQKEIGVSPVEIYKELKKEAEVTLPDIINLRYNH